MALTQIFASQKLLGSYIQYRDVVMKFQKISLLLRS